jgi:hypothetical protein
MSISYDQMSELTEAFEEAHVPADRRSAERIRQRIAAEISEWEGDHPGKSFGVMIEDFSSTGVGIVHTGRLEVGRKYLLEIPRRGERPIRVLLTVVRCSELDGGLFAAQMEISELLAARAEQPRPVQRKPRPALLVALAAAVATWGAFLLGWL